MAGSVEKYDSTKPAHLHRAPGSPGTDPRWTSSAKTAVGTSTSGLSHIWFTIGQGVLNEIYFPDVDKANTRTIRLLVTDGEHFFSDEEHDATHTCTAVEPGIPPTPSSPPAKADATASPRRLSLKAAATRFWCACDSKASSPRRRCACSSTLSRTWPTRVKGTGRGSASTKAKRCCSPAANTPFSPPCATCPGSRRPAATSAKATPTTS